MASVIHSARHSTASVFGVIGTAADAVTQLIGTGVCAIDALDAKARLMRDEVILDCKLRAAVGKDSAVHTAANEHADMMEEIHHRNFPGKPFDREAFFLAALKRMEDSIVD